MRSKYFKTQFVNCSQDELFLGDTVVVGTNEFFRIADEMDRTVPEITKKTKEAQKKMHQYTSGASMYSSSTVVTQRKGKSEETNKEEKPEVDEWSQTQQKLLEVALKKFGKDEENRWDKIAETVEGKTKRQCMLRYKFIGTLFINLMI